MTPEPGCYQPVRKIASTPMATTTWAPSHHRSDPGPQRRTAAAPLQSYVALILQGLREHQLPEAARLEVERALERKGGVERPPRTPL